MIRATAIATLLALTSAGEGDVVTFGDKPQPPWTSETDHVMAGSSDCTASVAEVCRPCSGKEGVCCAHVLDYQGTLRQGPFKLQGGFTLARTDHQLTTTVQDMSTYDGMHMGVRNLGNITDFKFAFCDSHLDFWHCQYKSFKADFSVPADSNLHQISFPWSAFSNKWDPATGKHRSENPPTESNLQSISQLQIWTEGLVGDFHLQVEFIRVGKIPNQAAVLV
jgi:hypothetical protein